MGFLNHISHSSMSTWPGLTTIVGLGIAAVAILMALGVLATLVATLADLRAISRGEIQEPRASTALLQSRWLPRGSRRVSTWQASTSAFEYHHHLGGENATRFQ